MLGRVQLPCIFLVLKKQKQKHCQIYMCVCGVSLYSIFFYETVPQQSVKCDNHSASPSTRSLSGFRRTLWGLIKNLCSRHLPETEAQCLLPPGESLPTHIVRQCASTFGVEFRAAAAGRCLECSPVVKSDVIAIMERL